MRLTPHARDGRNALLVLLAFAAAPARADATAFIGANTTPSNRPVKGFAVGMGLLIVAFEFEYADDERGCGGAGAGAEDRHGERAAADAGCRSSGFSRISRPAAGSIARRSARTRRPGCGTNVGGGVKVSLAGPLRLRVDYRVFKLGSGALNSPAHRFYAGLNLKF